MRGRGGARTVRRSGPQSRSSGRKQWGGAVEQGKEQRGITVNGGAGCRAGTTGRRATDGARVSGATVDVQSRSLVSFVYPTGATEETDVDTVIKMRGCRAKIYWADM
jgi:hypothetical protein